MKIAIAGASGGIGTLTRHELLRTDPRQDLVLVTRSPDTLRPVVGDGVEVRYGDYNDPASLRAAYDGADTLFLISGLNIGDRVREHRNAIEAARTAGVSHIVYTSFAGIHPRNEAPSAIDHIATEHDLLACGVPCTILRDAVYAEVFLIIGASSARVDTWYHTSGRDRGRFAPVARADVARCAAACLIDRQSHAGATYEITGPELLTMEDIARLYANAFDVALEYREVPIEERLAIFDSWGVPRQFDLVSGPHPDANFWPSEEIVRAERSISDGFQSILSDHVKFLTGRTPQTIASVMAAGSSTTSHRQKIG